MSSQWAATVSVGLSSAGCLERWCSLMPRSSHPSLWWRALTLCRNLLLPKSSADIKLRVKSIWKRNTYYILLHFQLQAISRRSFGSHRPARCGAGRGRLQVQCGHCRRLPADRLRPIRCSLDPDNLAREPCSFLLTIHHDATFISILSQNISYLNVNSLYQRC